MPPRCAPMMRKSGSGRSDAVGTVTIREAFFAARRANTFAEPELIVLLLPRT